MVHEPSREFIEGLGVKEGESVTIDCPVCNGIKKFSVTNQEGLLLYNCYRNSCDIKGAHLTPMLVDTIKNKIQGLEEVEKDRKFEMPEYITDGNNSYIQRFRRRWNLRVELMYDVKSKRAVFPIYQNGRIIDAIGRALFNAQPKWYKYGGKAKHYSYCINPCESIAVVVEDVISATVVGEEITGVTGVALLGTSLLKEHKEYLDTFDKVVVALDPDALGKTIEYTKELKSYCEPSEVYGLHIEDDLKYKREKDFNKLREMVGQDGR
tara:strand:- start:1211 stop:2008 length:798 start_codon:yes stop_codon:yes gene_type:complete